MMTSVEPKRYKIQFPRAGSKLRQIFQLKTKTRNPSNKNGQRKNGWMMTLGRKLEGRNYASLIRNHGFQFIGVQGKINITI